MYIDLSEYQHFSKSDFIGDGLELVVPRAVQSIELGEGFARLSLSAIVCRKEKIAISALMQGRSFNFAHAREEMGLLLECIGEDTLRMRLYHGREMPVKRQPMLVAEPAPGASFEISETEKTCTLSTSRMTIVIHKDPYRLEIQNAAGKTVFQQYSDDLHSVVNDRRRGFKEGDDDGQSEEDARLSFPGMECLPAGFAKNTENGKSCFVETARIAPGERFYGFGERFGPLDKNGQELLNWTINPVGVSTIKSYKVAPFFFSSAGYGAYYNTPRRIRFSMGNYFFKTYSCEIEDDLLDAFVFVCDTPAEILDRYTVLTGKSAVPPKWAFGAWMGRNSYRSRAEMEEVAQRLRDEALPCDVLHLDWDYCVGSYDFAFDESRFPGMKECTDGLLQKGFRLSAWQLPYLKEGSPAYQEAISGGFLAKDALGRPGDAAAGGIGVIDFSNPGAVAWYQEKLRGLLRQGVRVIKTDFGENAREDYRYHGIDGRDMHNLYPLLYNDAAFSVCQQEHPGDSLVWGRSAYSGCQRYPVYWGGDSDSDYSGLYHSMRGGLSMGLSGFPFWSHDVGGYFCTPEPDVYIRWMQMGMLSPLVRFHGTSEREPWAYGEEAVRQYKKYAAIRYSLIEYLYSEAIHCAKDGTPMMRALALDFPNDPAAAAIDTQYLLGRNILVAPVLDNEPTRRVYLPEGTAWFNLHARTWHHGGQWLAVETPIDIMPLFLRGQTITPFIAPTQYVDEKPIDEMHLEVCPVGDIARYTLRTGADTLSIAYHFDGDSGTGDITVLGDAPRLVFHINCPDVRRVRIHGRELAMERAENGFFTVIYED